MESTAATPTNLEVQMERSFDGLGVEVEREIPRIDLDDFDNRREAVIQGPGKRYEPISAADYLQQRIDANFVR